MKKIILFMGIIFAVNSVLAQWEPDVRLTYDPDSSVTSYSCSKSVASYEDNVHVVWSDNRDGNWEIYFKHSEDGGVTWGDDTRLTDAPGSSRSPSLAVSGNVVHVDWNDNRDGDGLREIY